MFSIVWYYLPAKLIEPDGYFHYAISKLISEQGVIKTWGSLPDLGWHLNFVDKEFLFHQLTSLGYQIAGESGVQFVCYLLSLGIVMMLMKLSVSLAGYKGYLIVLFGLLNFNFIFRMTLIRPHLAGLLLILVLIDGLFRNRKWIIAVGCLLFPLAYHAFYIPVFVLGAWFVFSNQVSRKTILLYGLFPLLCGILINPYFPGTLDIGLLGIKIGLQTSQAMNIGQEAKTLPLYQSLDAAGAYLALGLLIIPMVFQGERRDGRLAVLALLLCFTLLFFISPRSIEYLVPFLIITVAASLRSFKNFTPNGDNFLILALLLVNIRFSGFFFHDFNLDQRKMHSEVLTLLDKIPADDSKKLFNCEWDLGSLVLYKRPSLKINEALDPNFLYRYQPEMAKVKAFINDRPPVDLYFTMKQIFKSDYVLCLNEKVNSGLSRDPRFVKMGEGKSNPPLYLYRVSHQ